MFMSEQLMERAMKRLCVLMLFVVVSSVSHAVDPAPSSAAREYLKEIEKPIVLRGDYFKAVTVAYEDFLRTLTSRRTNAESAATASERDQLLYLSKIENYDINVRHTESTYIVAFGVTFRGGDPYMVMGGGLRYVLDRSTFAIKEKVPVK
jgi:hypothetical protein